MGFALLYPSYGAAFTSEVCRKLLSCGALALSPNNHRKGWMIKASATAPIHPTQWLAQESDAKPSSKHALHP